MSKKHEQRTRAEILAKRAQPIVEIAVQKKVMAPNGQTLFVPQSTSSEQLRTAFDASKYMPHFGAKQRAKLADKLPKAEKLAA
jgi:2-keto-3-deoxy-L-rhamnonate aldolase RhmA